MVTEWAEMKRGKVAWDENTRIITITFTETIFQIKYPVELKPGQYVIYDNNKAYAEVDVLNARYQKEVTDAHSDYVLLGFLGVAGAGGARIASASKNVDKATDVIETVSSKAGVSGNIIRSLDDVSPSIRDAFGPDARITTLTQDTIVYRYHGGTSEAIGPWFTTNKTTNPIADLALPPTNSAKYVDEVVLPKGTKVIEGTVAPNYTQPGGGYQYYVLR